MSLRLRTLVAALSLCPLSFLASLNAQVTGFALVKPAGAPGAVLALPGSVRRIALKCAAGCSTSSAASWSVSATTGGASATVTPSAAGNYADVTLGANGGTCPVTGSGKSYTVTPTATVTVKATASNDATKSDTILLDVCSPAVEAYTIPFYRVLYSGQREDVQGVVWGSSNTDGTWQIMQQPTGGDATLDDTRFRDTVFRATVKGLYKVRFTSSADSSKTSYSTFYVTGNVAPRLSQPNGTEPIDCTADPNTTGGTLDVGPTQKYINLEAIAPSAIAPGVTIRLHNEDATGKNPTTYHEWVQITGAGTHDNPIRLCGVPDAAGNLPVMDGTNATARADVLSPGYVSGLAGVLIYNTVYDPYPAYNGPAFVVVEGLALRNYGPKNKYYPAGTTSGATGYIVGSSGFRIQNCRDCEFNGSEVSANGNGVFSESNDSRAWGGVTERLLFEGNNVHDNGVDADVHEHNWYLQGWFQVVQFNQMPTYNKAAAGSQYKDRGISWFRYNLVGTGAQRSMDFVEDQDAPNYLDPNVYLTGMRVADPNDRYTGDQLAAAQEAWHHSATVYGNIFQQGNAGSIHFFADNAGGAAARTGSLEFYNNTANLAGSNSYRFDLFDSGDNGSTFLHSEWPTINAANVVLGGFSSTANPYFSWNTQRDAFMNFGKVLLPNAWGTNNQGCTANTGGTCDGTGWPYQSNSDAFFNGNLFNVTGAGNLVGGSSSYPFSTTSFQLTTTVAGYALTGSAATLPVRFQYVPGAGYAAQRTTVVNDTTSGVIGATDTIPPYVPVVVGPTAVSIALTPANVSLTVLGSTTLACTTTLSNGTTRACISPAVTSSNVLSASVSGLTVNALLPGSGTLTATAEGFTAKSSFNVSLVPVATAIGITISPSSLSLPQHGTATLTCTTTLSTGATRACLSPALTSANVTLVTVSGMVVTAGPSAGTTLVTVRAEGFVASISATVGVTQNSKVVPTVVSIALNPAAIRFSTGTSAQMYCAATLSDGTTRACLTPSLASSDVTVFTVSGLAMKTGNRIANALLTAYAEGKATSATVSVTGH